MHLPSYPLISDQTSHSYEFVSKGPKGSIKKVVQFQPTIKSNVYNLAFGDVDAITGEINDLAISNNEDTEKVLSTVVIAVHHFLHASKDIWIIASGSTLARNRLYRMGISKYHFILKRSLIIYGLKNGKWQLFQTNIHYESFLAKKASSFIPLPSGN